jgi:hypothetical protein
MLKFHVPGVLNTSQLALMGVVWLQTMMVKAIEVAAVTDMRSHSTAFCLLNGTTRKRKKPIESFAKALPMTMRVLATYVQKIALACSSRLSVQKLRPRPKWIASWMETVKARSQMPVQRYRWSSTAKKWTRRMRM